MASPRSRRETRAWTDIVVRLPEFLRRTCLSYCEFFELWKSGFVKFRNGADKRYGEFPECEPCCLEDLWIDFPDVVEASRTGPLRAGDLHSPVAKAARRLRARLHLRGAG